MQRVVSIRHCREAVTRVETFRMNDDRLPSPRPPPADAGDGARPLPPSAQKVADALRRAGIAAEVRVLADSARTAQEAASALGIVVGQIAKSLVFKGATSGKAVLVIAAGDNRVDEAKLAALIGEAITRADAAFVRDATGYAIGGIPPIGHATAMRIFVDETLARFPIVWAAAGTPHAVFPIAPSELFRVSRGRVADVKQD